MSSRTLKALTLASLVFALGSAGFAAWRQGWTYDEPAHLEWSRRLLDEGLTERRSSLHYNSKTPIVVPNVVARKLARRVLGVREETPLRFAARLPSIVWLGLLLVAVFWLGRRGFGETAACAATLLAALDPNLIAHGSLATVDVAYAFATLMTLGAAAAFAARPSLFRGLAWGLALGLAFATKFTAFLLLPGSLAVLLVSRSHDGWASRRWPRIVAGLLVGAAGATLLVSAAYGFRRFGVPLSNLRWKSELLLRASRALPDLALPLPADFMTGLDLVLDMERHKPLNVVILGGLHPDGVAYYFVVLWLLKTPLLAIGAVVFGLVRALRDGLWLASPLARALGVNLVLHLAYFSLLFRYQTGYRFVLMCVPLACLLAGAGLRSVLVGRHGALALSLFLGVSLVEHAAYLGNPLSFTQGLVWPKREVFRLIADSNVDWGQNDDAIDGWLLAAGVPKTHLNPPHVLPGHNSIDLNLLAGVDDFEQHRWLREHASPGGHFGHTWLWFEVEPAFFERLLDGSRRRPAEPWASKLCAAAGSPEPVADEHRVRVSTSPDAVSVWCVSATAPVDLILTGQEGRCLFGLANAKLRDWEPIGPGNQVWHRLDPGLHAFALARASGFEGNLRVSVRGAVAASRLSGQLADDGVISPGSLVPVPGAP